jgi:hypothetical protein
MCTCSANDLRPQPVCQERQQSLVAAGFSRTELYDAEEDHESVLRQAAMCPNFNCLWRIPTV